MTALAVALVLVAIFAAIGLGTFAVMSWSNVERDRVRLKHDENRIALALDRDRFEATRPLPPHEELVKRVGLLETKVDAMMSRAGFEVVGHGR